MQPVTPTARAYANYVTQIGSSPGPNDGQDAVQASTVVAAVLSLGNTDAYLAATVLGPQYAPPTAQPPAFVAVDANGFYTNGVQRVRTINSVASVATTLASLAGHPGDLAALVYGGTGATWGIYMLIPGTFQTPDAFTCVTQVSVGTGQWVLVGPGKSLITAVGGSSSYAARLAQLNSVGVLDPTELPQASTSTTVFPVPANLYALVNSGATGQQVNLASGYTVNTPGDPAFWRDNSGLVRMRGSITVGSPSNSTVFTLPAGFRPLVSRALVVNVTDQTSYQGNGWAFARLVIGTSGIVQINEITFQIGTSASTGSPGAILWSNAQVPASSSVFWLDDVSFLGEA